MVKPNFIIVGTQKGGTESLRRHLGKHKDIFMYFGETHFFDDNNEYNKGYKYYEEKFKTDKKCIGEKTPVYMYDKRALERIHKYDPNMKIIVVLREPISRAYSQWNMYQQRKNNKYKNVSFTDMVNDYMGKNMNNVNYMNVDKYDILKRGIYVYQILNIYELFKRENVLIIISEELRNKPLKTMNEICKFLGVSRIKSLKDIDYRNDVHKKSYNSLMSKNNYMRLYLYYNKYNEVLYKLIGKTIIEWENIYKEFFEEISK